MRLFCLSFILSVLLFNTALAAPPTPNKKNKTMQQDSSDSNPSAETGIYGKWVLTYIEGEDIDKLYPGKKPTLELDKADNRISGFNGCNQYFGKVTLQNFKISFPQPLGSTLRACEDSRGESVYMDVLGRISSYALLGQNSLQLIAGDIGLMSFERQP